jgi:D-arabinose 1-dehydrogenase-like Zn-dependent alcohol dehydrogenase
MVLGHEISGIVTGVGDKATRYKIGDRVAVGSREAGRITSSTKSNSLAGSTIESDTLT